MFRVVKIVLVAVVVVYVATTVKIGNRTVLGHLLNIWRAPQTQELVDGLRETAAPVVTEVARSVRAGVGEMGSSGAKEVDGGGAEGRGKEVDGAEAESRAGDGSTRSRGRGGG